MLLYMNSKPIIIIDWYKTHLFGLVKIYYQVIDMKPEGSEFDYGKWKFSVRVSVYKSMYVFECTYCDLRINHKLKP